MKGRACLNAWETKKTGEVGLLVYTPYGDVEAEA